MSRRIAALPIAALLALAIGLPSAGQAHPGKGPISSPGKSGDHKPAGVGGGRRVR